MDQPDDIRTIVKVADRLKQGESAICWHPANGLIRAFGLGRTRQFRSGELNACTSRRIRRAVTLEHDGRVAW